MREYSCKNQEPNQEPGVCKMRRELLFLQQEAPREKLNTEKEKTIVASGTD